MTDRIIATYLIETAHPLQQAAAAMAGEQSSGTFVAVPGETDELRQRHGAQPSLDQDGESLVQDLVPVVLVRHLKTASVHLAQRR